ncbi:hypothetical protein C8Q74DRAFT_1230395 [Fomes fomentarius]|nr:hypothetical protein C8Q74DRAFT_1230395 [Fomes fomentarius]
MAGIVDRSKRRLATALGQRPCRVLVYCRKSRRGNGELGGVQGFLLYLGAGKLSPPAARCMNELRLQPQPSGQRAV